MKKTVIFLMVLLCSLCLFAGDYQDLGFSVGLGTTRLPKEELSLSYQMDLGLTSSLELDLWGISDIIPVPGDNTVLGLELGKTILGVRSTGSKVSGANINTIVTLGGFYSISDNGAGITLGLTPLYAGSPSAGKREKYATTRFGWDFVNQKLLVAFSLVDYEFYVRGRAENYL